MKFAGGRVVSYFNLINTGRWLTSMTPRYSLAHGFLFTLKNRFKAAFLLAAFFGVATLWMAVFADMGASLLVTLNGMRLLKSDR